MVALFDLVDRDLATRVAERIGITPPTGEGIEIRDAAGEVLHAIEHKPEPGRWVDASPALSQMNTVKGSIKSRRVAVLLAPGFDGAQFQSVKTALEAGGAHPDVVSLALGVVRANGRRRGAGRQDVAGCGVGAVRRGVRSWRRRPRGDAVRDG